MYLHTLTSCKEGIASSALDDLPHVDGHLFTGLPCNGEGEGGVRGEGEGGVRDEG